MLNRKPWKRFEQGIDLQGSIRALEVTHGFLNGWHVHFHVLLIINKSLEDENNLNQAKDDIFSQWYSACLTAGLEAPSQKHGVNLDFGDYASDYVAKWGVDHELTKGHMKKGFDGNLSPFDFLDKFIDGDQRYKALFQEFAKAFKGRKQLLWSRGLRTLLKMVPENPDEEIANSEEPDSEIFARITCRQWSVILKKEKRGQVLEACHGGKEALFAYLDLLQRDFVSFKTGG